ncbi:ribonuclease Z [Halobacteriales archaeon Cl-PHB]
MRVTFLGTSGAVPTTERNPSALLVAREGDRTLFDCGEGTQRQMMRYGTGFDVDHVCLTHLHGDHVLGLPGLVQTWDFNDRAAPLAIHAPSGTRSAVEDLVTVTGEDPDYPVRIHPVSPGDVAFEGDGYEIRAVRVDHRTNAVGYALVEDERKGRFDREKAEEELGIPPGPKYSKLHRGEPVDHQGRTIQPDEVVGPPRPGRKLVYTGDTRPCDGVRQAAREADLLVHDGTFTEEYGKRAQETAHSTAREAAHVANDAGAKRLALTHVSTRFGGNVRPLQDEVEAAFEGEKAFVADDGMAVQVPFPDADEGFEIAQSKW